MTLRRPGRYTSNKADDFVTNLASQLQHDVRIANCHIEDFEAPQPCYVRGPAGPGQGVRAIPRCARGRYRSCDLQLGTVLRDGRGCPTGRGQGIRAIPRRAPRKYPKATNRPAKCYKKREGVEQDLAKAWELFLVAHH